MFRLSTRFGASACALSCALLLSVSRVHADEVAFHFDPDFSGMPPGGYLGGESIPYSVFVNINDTEADGFESQGLHGFAFDILSDTGIMQPQLAFAPSNTVYPYITIADDVWSSGKTPALVGGFGMGFFPDFGNNVTSVGDVLGAGSSIGLSWDPDVDNNVGNGLQPPALHGIGIGLPPGTDVGGNTVPPAGAREQWFLMQGQITVPGNPGLYTVDLDPQAVTLISPTVDLNTDLSAGWLASGQPTLIGDSFQFTVLPEPATASFLLLAGAALTLRRRM